MGQDFGPLFGDENRMLKVSSQSPVTSLDRPSVVQRLYRVFEAENRDWNGELKDDDDKLARGGRIMDSMLSEHMCEGWLEGTCLQDVTVSLQATKHLSVLLTPWLHSMQNG